MLKASESGYSKVIHITLKAETFKLCTGRRQKIYGNKYSLLFV